MPINIGDAVLTFLGDTTQLDAAFDSVNQNAKSKLAPAADQAKAVGESMKKSGADSALAGAQVSESWIKVARATQDSAQAQKQLSIALDNVKKAGDGDVVALLSLAQAQQNAATSALRLSEAQREASRGLEKMNVDLTEARGSLALIGEESGIRVPRHLRTFVAELPGVGAALAGAFNAFAIVVLIQLLAEGVEKLVEWHQAAEKLREEWTKSETDFRLSSNSIKDEIDRQQIKFIELTQGPIAAYDFALKHLRSTADESLSKVTSQLDQMAQKFDARGGLFKSLFGGSDSANAKKMAEDLARFNAELQETVHTAEDARKDDPFAGYVAGIDKLNEKINELTKVAKAARENLNNTDFLDPSRLAMDPQSIERAVTILEHVRELLELARQEEATRREAFQREELSRIQQHELEVGSARININRQVALAVLAVQTEEARERMLRGKETQAEFLAQEKGFANQRYQDELHAVQDRLALLQKDPNKNEAAIIEANGRIRELELQHKLELLKIDQDAYKFQADLVTRGMEQVVASTRLGTKQRVEAEKVLSEQLKATWGETSDAYQNSLTRIAEAQKEFLHQQERLRQEDRTAEEALASDKSAAELKYYEYLKQTARISAADLLQIQKEESDVLYQRKRKALQDQISQLGPEEELAHKKLLHDLTLLDQQYEEEKRLRAAQTVDILELQYQELGLKSGEVWGREAKLAEEAFNVISKSGGASYAELLQAQIKLLEATIAWKESLGQNVSKDVSNLDKLNNAYHRLQLTTGALNKNVSLGKTLFHALGVDAQLMGGKIQNAAVLTTGALEEMFMAWAQGGITVKQAAEQIAAAVLKSLAQYAFAKATEQLALGFAAMSPVSPDFGHAGEHFASAALWFAAGAATSVAAGLLTNSASRSGKDSGSGNQSNVIQENNATTAPGSSSTTTTEPVPTVSIQHFSEGGLVGRKTLALLGDSLTASGQEEAAIPLDNPRAVEKIVAALGGERGGDTHVHIKGVISDDVLGEVMRKISRKAIKGTGRITTSAAIRVIRRT